MAKSLKRDERCRPSSQRPQYPTLYRRLKRRLGRSLRSKFYKGSVVRSGKKATHKHPRIEGGLTGPSKLQGPVPEPNSSSCNGQLNSGSLHKQTRRNSLSRDVCSPVEDHDLVPSLSHNIESQTHSRVPECDGRPSIQVKPSAVNRMVTTSTGVQTDLPKVVHTQRKLLHLRGHQQEPSTSQSGPYFEKWCRENSVDFSTPSVKQVSDFFMYLYQDLNRRPLTIDGYRTAIVDTLGPNGPTYCTKFRPS